MIYFAWMKTNVCDWKGHEVNFGANKLKSGSGEQVVYTLNRLADEALKTKNFAWRE